MPTFKIKLRGQELPKEISQAEDQAMGYYNIQKTFTVESSTRSDVPEQVLELKEGEILELDFEDNSFWLGDADSIKQIFSKELKRGGDGMRFTFQGILRLMSRTEVWSKRLPSKPLRFLQKIKS